ncbi:MAG: hypothetical protein LBJ63_03085 [Prevotellaceae bacterium]|jgi:hypothetical protein|nr:hypothetical protein [Prevotellaceae bacterium]
MLVIIGKNFKNKEIMSTPTEDEKHKEEKKKKEEEAKEKKEKEEKEKQKEEEEKKKRKLKEYQQRHGEWRDIAVNQLSAVNNILITLATGLLVFYTSKDNTDRTNTESDWHIIAYISLLISILYGIGVLFSRLYDARLSRHLALCRKRCCKKKDQLLPDNDADDSCWISRLCNFFKVVFCKIPKISMSDIEKKDNCIIRKKFEEIQKQSTMLGVTTWIWLKCQVGFFLIASIIIYLMLN